MLLVPYLPLLVTLILVHGILELATTPVDEHALVARGRSA